VLACLWGQYSGSAETQLQADAIQARDASIDGLLGNLKNRAKRTESLIPDFDDYREQVVQGQGVTLGLLLHMIGVDALSFPSGKRLKQLAEPLEVHHIFPRAYLNQHSSETRTFQADRLGNLTVLYRNDNEYLSDMSPKKSLADCDKETLSHHCIPLDPDLRTIDNYGAFCEAREKLLAENIGALLGKLLGTPLTLF
jgi:hypothetical protein